MSNQQSNTWRNEQISTYKNLEPDSLRLQLTHICPSSLIIHQNLWFPQTLHGREEHEPAAEAEGSGEGLERPGHPSPLCSPQGLLRLWGAASYDQLHLSALPCLFRRAPTEIGEVDYVFYSILQTTLYLQHVLYYNYRSIKDLCSLLDRLLRITATRAVFYIMHANLHHITHEIYAHNSHFGALLLLVLLPQTLHLL